MNIVTDLSKSDKLLPGVNHALSAERPEKYDNPQWQDESSNDFGNMAYWIRFSKPCISRFCLLTNCSSSAVIFPSRPTNQNCSTHTNFLPEARAPRKRRKARAPLTACWKARRTPVLLFKVIPNRSTILESGNSWETQSCYAFELTPQPSFVLLRLYLVSLNLDLRNASSEITPVYSN